MLALIMTSTSGPLLCFLRNGTVWLTQVTSALQYLYYALGREQGESERYLLL